MKPSQSFVPFFKLLFLNFRGLLKALLKYTKEAYRRHQFKGKEISRLDIHQVVGEVDEEVKGYTYLDGTSRTIDIAFLKSICKQFKDCNYLEIGSWRGESLLNVAEVATKCTSISLSKKEMMAMGIGEEEAQVQGLLSSGIANVRHIEANSLSFDFESLEEKFDVIFIDGDHSYEGVKSDTRNAFELLRNENSVIIWHDSGFGMQDLRYETIMAIYDGCPEGAFEKIHRVSNTMCAIFTNKRFDTWPNVASSNPSKLFHLTIKSNSYTKT